MSGSRRRSTHKVEGWHQIGDSNYAMPAKVTRTTGDDAPLPYYVTITIENDSGTPVCTEIRFTPRPDGPPISSSGIREIPVARLIEWANSTAVVRLANADQGVGGGVLMINSREQVDEATHALESEQTAGRRRITNEELQRLATICAVAEATGESYIAKAALEMGLTHDQARQWKRKAIKAGLLPARETNR